MRDANGHGAKLSGDRPKKFMADDEFGLDKIATAIAINITSNVPVDGYTVGLDGDWGSGKTTITNFIVQKIEELAPQARIIRIDPWLIGNKSAFISSFLAELAKQIDDYEYSTKRWWNVFFWLKFWFDRKIKRGLGAKIRKYGEYTNILSSAVSGLASTDPTSASAMAAVGLRSVGTLSTLISPKTQSIAALKSDIVDSLRKLAAEKSSPRFVAVIDDTDRLEPTEAVEVLRLIREIADFPLTTYLVCFDKGILAQQIRSALKIGNGLDYIEKIFHQIIAVPPQEPFALRRYLAKLLSDSFFNEFNAGDTKDKDYEYRKHLLMDIWAGRLLKTPRDVIRLYDAVVFGWSHLPKKADFIDFIWLQMIRLYASNLYAFTQSYLVEVGAYRDGGRPSDLSPKAVPAIRGVLPSYLPMRAG
jgi:predicted KAP-like P-loop ATPase